jgi:hypothetical protein
MVYIRGFEVVRKLYMTSNIFADVGCKQANSKSLYPQFIKTLHIDLSGETNEKYGLILISGICRYPFRAWITAFFLSF